MQPATYPALAYDAPPHTFQPYDPSFTHSPGAAWGASGFGGLGPPTVSSAAPEAALYDPAQAALQPGVVFPAAHETDAGAVQPQPQPQQPQTVDVMALFGRNGRESRPRAFVVLVRGVPGSGKSWLARRLRDLGQEEGGQPPRVLSIDAFFMVDTDDGGEVYRHDAAAEGVSISDVWEDCTDRFERSCQSLVVACTASTGSGARGGWGSPAGTVH
jgi:hypothetical protein